MSPSAEPIGEDAFARWAVSDTLAKSAGVFGHLLHGDVDTLPRRAPRPTASCWWQLW